jgi:PAS domain S-box-containing protein
MNVRDLYDERTAKLAYNHFQNVVKKGFSSGKLPFKHKNGTKHWWSIDAVKIDNDRFIGFCKDITNSVKLKNKVIEQKSFLNNILDTTTDGIFVLDSEYKFTYWNRGMENIFGVPRIKIFKSEKKAWHLFPHLKENGTNKLMKRAMDGEIVHKSGVPYKLRNGKQGFTTDSYFPLFNNQQDHVRGIVGVIRDITEEEKRKKELNLLADVANRLVTIEDESVFEFLGSVLYQFCDNVIVSVNEIKGNSIKLKHVFGIDEKTISMINRLMGKHNLFSTIEGISEGAKIAFFTGKLTKIDGGLYDAFFKKIPKPICTTLERILNIKSLYSIGLRRKDKVYGAVTFVVRDDSKLNTDIIETIINETSVVLEKIESFNALKSLNKNLEEKVEKRTERINNLLVQKDEMINQLGHDLKNPLGPIINLVPILMKKEKDPKKLELLNAVLRSSEYMKNIVVKSIQLAKLNASIIEFDFRELSLKDEIDEIINTNLLLFEENDITVENHVADQILVKADKFQLKELFNNLLNNAVKYTEHDGRVFIDATYDDGMVQVSVEDEGIGMTDEQIGKVFNEFYKADGSRHDFDSSGLGMPICKRIAERHGGRIWAESEGIGKGSTFKFTLKAPQN